jgi:hypothetical protein
MAKASSKKVFAGRAAQAKTQNVDILQSGVKYSQEGFDGMMRFVLSCSELMPDVGLTIVRSKK